MLISPRLVSTTRLFERMQRRPSGFGALDLTRRAIPTLLVAGLVMLAGCVDESDPTNVSVGGPDVGANASPASIAAALGSSKFQALLRENVRGINVDLTELQNHEMRPANVVGVDSDEGLDEKEPDAPVRALLTDAARRLASAEGATLKREVAAMPGQPSGLGPIWTLPRDPYLDVGGFCEAFHAAIKDNVVGYALRITQNGRLVCTLQWNWAQTPADASLGWSADRRMHVASVSKLITATAMVRLLQENGIDYDDKIINYLPTYWQKGPNIDDISFADLLTHMSGFSTGGSSSDFAFMRAQVAAGVAGVGSYDYENMNFGLCRILIAVINGNVSKHLYFGGLSDVVWDALTLTAYGQYVSQKVFVPAAVAGPTFNKPAWPARAYAFPAVGSGWNSGNLMSVAGGAGWHMSINEVLRVMRAFRAGLIVPPSDAQDALDAGFGIDRIISTSAGNLYDKNGLWRDGSQRTEQSVAVFMPDGLDIVVFVNSPIGMSGASLRNLVRDLYIANIVGP